MLISLLFSNFKISYLITFQIINYVNFLKNSFSLHFKSCNFFNYSNFMHISYLILNLSKCKKKFTRESEKNFIYDLPLFYTGCYKFDQSRITLVSHLIKILIFPI